MYNLNLLLGCRLWSGTCQECLQEIIMPRFPSENVAFDPIENEKKFRFLGLPKPRNEVRSPLQKDNTDLKIMKYNLSRIYYGCNNL